MLVLFVVVIIALAAVAVVALARRQLESVRSAWQRVAAELGLNVESLSLGRGKITGSADDMQVTVEVTGSGDTTHTRYRVDYPPQTTAFNLRRESGGQRILKRFGAEDREMGDPEFDELFIVQTTDPEALRSWLTAAKRSSLVRLLVRYPGLLVSERRLEIASKGVETDPETIVSTVRRMLATTRHLTGRAPAAHVEKADELRRTGDLLAALAELNSAVTADPSDLESKLLRAETAVSAGDVDQARADVAALETELAADPEVRGLREVVERAIPAAAAATAGGLTDAVDARAMFQRIFGQNHLSFETDELFAAEYRGRPIELTGRVKSARQVDRDLDFGPGAKAKVVASVASIESDLYGNTIIDAVVELPSSAATLPRGTEITFRGRLLRVDPMMRNVYVSDASLT